MKTSALGRCNLLMDLNDVHPASSTEPLKNGGWKTILSYWVSVTLQGRTVKLPEGMTITPSFSNLQVTEGLSHVQRGHALQTQDGNICTTMVRSTLLTTMCMIEEIASKRFDKNSKSEISTKICSFPWLHISLKNNDIIKVSELIWQDAFQYLIF